MRHKDKSSKHTDLPFQPFFPDEQAETAAAIAVELRDRIAKLEEQVLAQYTSTAAHAMIAGTHVETARAEGRSDLDRSQGIVIRLMEKFRNEVNARLEVIERRTVGGDLSVDGASRIARVEHDLAAATSSLQQCLRDNEHLRSQVAELVEHRMQEQGWLVSSGAAGDLSLR